MELVTYAAVTLFQIPKCHIITNANQHRANTGKKGLHPYSAFDSDYILPNFTSVLWDQCYLIYIIM
jgi:hypothetical protein